MAESIIKLNKTPIYQNITISSGDDEAIKLIETTNEDYKSITAYIGAVLRYRLFFRNGHLWFASFDANGNPIVSQTQIV